MFMTPQYNEKEGRRQLPTVHVAVDLILYPIRIKPASKKQKILLTIFFQFDKKCNKMTGMAGNFPPLYMYYLQTL